MASLPVKERLFAHPDNPGARDAGGLEQMAESKLGKKDGFETFDAYFSRPFGLDPSKVRLHRLRKGAHVIGGTVLGRVGRPDSGGAARLDFSIRPAGRGAPLIDPKPILDGWKLLEATAIYRASGRNVLYGGKGGSASIGQILLWPKRLLERRVLSDERIELYGCGRDDVSPARSTGACSPRSSTWPSPASSPRSPRSSAATASTPAPATSPSTARAAPWTSPRSTASRSSATRRPAASPSRPCAG